MTTQNKTIPTDSSVNDFINQLSTEQEIADSLELVRLMSKISGHQPVMWGPAIIGFDTYHYKYASGREGDGPVLGFSPRKGKLSVYVEETSKTPELLARLGKHTSAKVCIYIKRLSDIDMGVLEEILTKSYHLTKQQYPAGTDSKD